MQTITGWTTVIQTTFASHDDVLTRIHDRWLRVLDLIIADKGNNDKVEQNRGLKQNPLSEESNQIEDLEEDVLMDEVSDGVVELG